MRRTWAALLASTALHALAFAAVSRAPRPRRADNVAVEILEERAVPPAPPAPPPPAPPPSSPPPAPVAARPAPRRVALAPPPHAPPAPPRAPDEAPPPPNAPPPQNAQPPERAPVRIGVSLSSTTEAGGFAAPVGNTLYGQMPRSAAPAPTDVVAYRAERYVPPSQVTALPKPLGCRIPESEYPPDARRLEIEAPVVLMLLVDETGRVVDARVVSDPGHGLGPAAVRSAKLHCRFDPPRRGDERVATWIRYTIHYELP